MPSRSTHLPSPTAQRPPPLSLTTGSHLPSSSSGRVGLRQTPAVPQPHPSCHGRPSSRRQSSPSSFTPWPLLPPSNHALTHRDEPEITQPLSTTSSPAVIPLHRLGVPPPGPYKRPPPPRSDSAPLTTSLSSSLKAKHAPVEPHRRHHFTLVAPPLRCSPSSGEPRGEFPMTPFPFPAAIGKSRQAGAPPRPHSGGFLSMPPCGSPVDQPEAVVHEAWTGSKDFPLQNKSEKLKFSISWHFCKEAPEFLYN
jgi:hypothetical protein